MKKGKNFSANNISGKRKESDYYPTPFGLTRQILEREKLNGTILEPAAGKDGAILKVLKEFNYNYTAYDKETDFLKETRKFNTIITNPPFSLAMEFVLKAKEIAIDKILFLLPLAYLHGVNRLNNIYLDKEFPLSKVYVFARYPMLGDELRIDGKYRTGMLVMAWFCFEKKHIGEPIIRWINNQEYILSKKDAS
jgi:hypothetical protein